MGEHGGGERKAGVVVAQRGEEARHEGVDLVVTASRGFGEFEDAYVFGGDVVNHGAEVLTHCQHDVAAFAFRVGDIVTYQSGEGSFYDLDFIALFEVDVVEGEEGKGVAVSGGDDAKHLHLLVGERGVSLAVGGAIEEEDEASGVVAELLHGLEGAAHEEVLVGEGGVALLDLAPAHGHLGDGGRKYFEIISSVVVKFLYSLGCRIAKCGRRSEDVLEYVPLFFFHLQTLIVGIPALVWGVLSHGLTLRRLLCISRLVESAS